MQELFQKADKDRDGKLTFSELRQILWEGSKEYSHLAEHARFLDGCDLMLRTFSQTRLRVVCGLHASAQSAFCEHECSAEHAASWLHSKVTAALQQSTGLGPQAHLHEPTASLSCLSVMGVGLPTKDGTLQLK